VVERLQPAPYNIHFPSRMPLQHLSAALKAFDYVVPVQTIIFYTGGGGFTKCDGKFKKPQRGKLTR